MPTADPGPARAHLSIRMSAAEQEPFRTEAKRRKVPVSQVVREAALRGLELEDTPERRRAERKAAAEAFEAEVLDKGWTVVDRFENMYGERWATYTMSDDPDTFLFATGDEVDWETGLTYVNGVYGQIFMLSKEERVKFEAAEAKVRRRKPKSGR